MLNLGNGRKHGFLHGMGFVLSIFIGLVAIEFLKTYVPTTVQYITTLSKFLNNMFNLDISPSVTGVAIIGLFVSILWGIGLGKILFKK